MSDPEPAAEIPGPAGDPARFPALAALDRGFRTLPAPPSDRGSLLLIVRRRPDGGRETPAAVRLTVDDGVPGDRWSRRQPRLPEAQITVMRRDVAELIANGQPITLFGDNLFVDLDLSADNLPPGTRLQVGEAIVEVTPKPHNGCVKFRGRFGGDALEFVSAMATRGENLRGIYWQVIEPGEVKVGDVIRILRRAGRV
jgi:MOSC domain-containing protein YiiM